MDGVLYLNYCVLIVRKQCIHLHCFEENVEDANYATGEPHLRCVGAPKVLYSLLLFAISLYISLLHLCFNLNLGLVAAV